MLYKVSNITPISHAPASTLNGPATTALVLKNAWIAWYQQSSDKINIFRVLEKLIMFSHVRSMKYSTSWHELMTWWEVVAHNWTLKPGKLCFPNDKFFLNIFYLLVCTTQIDKFLLYKEILLCTRASKSNTDFHTSMYNIIIHLFHSIYYFFIHII